MIVDIEDPKVRKVFGAKLMFIRRASMPWLLDLLAAAAVEDLIAYALVSCMICDWPCWLSASHLGSADSALTDTLCRVLEILGILIGPLIVLGCVFAVDGVLRPWLSLMDCPRRRESSACMNPVMEAFEERRQIQEACSKDF